MYVEHEKITNVSFSYNAVNLYYTTVFVCDTYIIIMVSILTCIAVSRLDNRHKALSVKIMVPKRSKLLYTNELSIYIIYIMLFGELKIYVQIPIL